jgi:hypothetical protein
MTPCGAPGKRPAPHPAHGPPCEKNRIGSPMETMPRPRPMHLLRETSRHRTVSWVARIGRGPRIYLRAAHGSSAFEAEYHHAAIRGEPVSGPRKPGLARLVGGDT